MFYHTILLFREDYAHVIGFVVVVVVVCVCVCVCV
jgi:hypothetical protein